MTPAGRWPARACVAGLAYLAVALLVAPPAGASAPAATRLLVGLLAAAPLLVLLATRTRTARWGTWVALVMIPYVTLSVGSWLVSPATRASGVAFALVASIVFFSGVFAARVPLSR